MKLLVIWILTILVVINTGCKENLDNQQRLTTAEMKNINHSDLLLEVQNYVIDIESEFHNIPSERKKDLEIISSYIRQKSSENEKSNLIFICTHNSRRSHMSQIWAQTAAYFYGIKDVYCFSGGTESTAFNSRSVRALRKAGFNIEQTDSTSNPVYLVKYSTSKDAIKGFSKKYDEDPNPKENFVAVMTCSQADQSCPYVSGSALRVAIPYEDPKVADNTPEEEMKYDERCRQIAVEMFYLFSEV
jgi:protein-tyrosine-phosphatase